MATYYCTDANLTDRISQDLTGSEVDTEAKRTAKCRAPATARIDSLVPGQSPFADIAATPATPSVIQQACIAFALAELFRILSNNPDNGLAETYERQANNIMQVDENGLSHLTLSSNYLSFGTPDIQRDRDEEAEDEEDLVM
jgi:hypothetical protein